MTIPDYTLVVGLDKKHLWQFSYTWQTWKLHKPDFLRRPMVAFYDHEQIADSDIRAIVDHPNLLTVPWPPEGVVYEPGNGDKWTGQQRYKMLAGFVHVPPEVAQTPYWLKMDVDVVATGQPDWIDEFWFKEQPAIVSHSWSFTKPGDQMVKLDAWAAQHNLNLPQPPLNMYPTPGSNRLGHKRISSWCCFTRIDFSRWCSNAATLTCGEGKLPVPSQDGYIWYMARRFGLPIVRERMFARGWEHWSVDFNVVYYSLKALGVQCPPGTSIEELSKHFQTLLGPPQ